MAGEASSSKENQTKSYIHPAYSVTNIQTKIRTLDGKNITYSSWVKLFLLHLKAYKVLTHVDGTPPPPETDPTYAEWSEIDALILQWIYSTISDVLLDRIMESDISAREAWTKLQDIFLSNKKARASALLHEFTHTTLKDCASMDAYCQKLKTLSRQLADVDKPIDESSLIIQLVNGLPKELDTIGTIINAGTPTWDETLTIIDLEMRRLSARTGLSTGNHAPHESLLYTSRGPNKPESTIANSGSGQTYPGSNYRGNNYDPNFNFRMGRGGRGNRGRGGRHQNHHNRTNTIHQYSNYPTQQSTTYPNAQPTTPAHWNTTSPQPHYHNQPHHQPTVPPTPYPSAPPHQAHYTGPPHQAQYGGPPQPPPPGLAQPAFNGLSPSDIGAALSSMQLNYRDPYWYMDTGASSHLTSDSGPQGWTPPFPSQ